MEAIDEGQTDFLMIEGVGEASEFILDLNKQQQQPTSYSLGPLNV